MSSQARIAKVSNRLYWLVSAVLLAAPVGVIWAFGYAFAHPDFLLTTFPNLPPETEITPLKSGLVIALGTLTFLPLLMAFVHMRGLFGRYRRAEILTNPCAHHITRIGQWLMGAAGMALALPTLQGLALTFDNPPGARVLSISASSNTVAVFLIAGLLTVIGWALRDAARIADENAGFV